MLALLVFPLLSGLRVNAAMLSYGHRLVAEKATRARSSYPYFSDPAASQASSSASPASGSPTDRWGRLRIALAAGDFASASRIAETLPATFLSRGLPLYDALLAHALADPEKASNLLAGRADMALSMPKSVRDTIVAGMYQVGLPQGDQRAYLETIRVLRPDDLLAAYSEWQSGEPDSQASMAAATKLSRFTKDAVLPAERRLYPAIYATIPSLYASGLWDKHQTVVIAGRLIEDCVEPEAAERMLQALRAEEPDAAGWDQLTAKLASCQSGLGAQARSSGMALATLDAEVMSGAFNVPDAALGDNLIVNGDFATLSVPAMTPEWWRWSCPQFPRGDEALFFHDRPSGRDDSGVAILGFWRDESRPGVCGFYHATRYAEQLRRVPLEPGATYLLAFDYRTEYLSDGDAGVYVEASPGVFHQAGLPLPETGGCWHRFYLLGINPNSSAEDVLLMLYSGGHNKGVGRAEFDHVSLRQVTSDMPSLRQGQTHLTHSLSFCQMKGE